MADKPKRISFFRLARTINTHWIWENPQQLKWWLDILLQANYGEKPVEFKCGSHFVKCGRGQCAYSLETWAKRWRVDKSKVRRFLELLRKDNMIDTKNVTKTTLITICNYDTYNPIGNDSDTITDTILTRLPTPIEEVVEDKKERRAAAVPVIPPVGSYKTLFEAFRSNTSKDFSDYFLYQEIEKFKAKYKDSGPDKVRLIQSWISYFKDSDKEPQLTPEEIRKEKLKRAL